jgi:TP901 family phage tail tape measure protein
VALATRNIYLVMKARDEASRVLRGFGRELTRAGALARADRLRNLAALATEKAAMMEIQGAPYFDVQKQKLIAQQLSSQARALERSHRAAVRFSNALHTVASTLITMGAGLTIAGAGGLAFLYSSVRVAQEYGRQVALTKTQVTGFTTSLEELSAVGLRVARSVAIPFEEIQPALYDVFSSTNANVRQAEILLEGFAKTAVAGQVTLQEASRGTIPILNAFNIPLEKVNDVLDIQFQLVRKGVGTYGEFAKIFGRVVPSATRAGQDFQHVAAMLAFMTRNGLSAAMASTSAARALDALSHPKSVAAMEKLGIKVRDLKGNFLPLEQTLKGLREHLLKLPPATRVAELISVFKGAGGTIQARRFLEQVLLKPGELEEFVGFLDDMNHATGAFGAAYGEMSDTVAAKTVLLRNRWKVLQESIGRAVTPAFLVVVTGLSNLIEKFNNLSPATKKTIAIVLALASAFFVVSGVILTVVGFLAGVTAAIIAAGSSFFFLIGAMALVVAMVTGFGVAIITAWKRSEGFRGSIRDLIVAFKRLYNEAILPTAIGLKDAWDKHMAPALAKFQMFMEEKVIPIVQKLTRHIVDEVIPAAKELGNWLVLNVAGAFDKISERINNYLIPALALATSWYYKHQGTVNNVITALIWLVKMILKASETFAGPLTLAAAIVIGSLVTTITTLYAVARAIEWVVNFVKSIVNWFRRLDDETTVSVAGVMRRVVIFKDTLVGIKDTIANWFRDAGMWLYQAGASLIEGLVHGVESKLSWLGSKLGSVGRFIKDFFPASPAKRGPLSGSGGLYYSGQKMIDQLISGMRSRSADASGVVNRIGTGMVQAPGTAAAGKSVQQVFHITTQELNPRRQAQELGFLLAGRS